MLYAAAGTASFLFLHSEGLTLTADFTDALFTVDFGRRRRPRPFQRLHRVARLSPHGTSLSLQRVVDECEECLGEGPLDFRIVQEKIALS